MLAVRPGAIGASVGGVANNCGGITGAARMCSFRPTRGRGRPSQRHENSCPARGHGRDRRVRPRPGALRYARSCGERCGGHQPQCDRARCGLQLLTSADGGRHWHAVPAPPLRIGAIAAVTFANARDGWLYGAQVLWATHNGGARWHRVPLPPGGRLESLTPGAGRILATIGRCSSDGLACSFRLWTAPAGSDAFRPVPGAAGPRHAPEPTVAISGRTGFAYATWLDRPVGEHILLAGPADGTHRWHRLRDPCGPSWSAALAAEHGGQRVLIACGTEPGAGLQIKQAYLSADAGRTWRRVAKPPPGGYVGDASAAGTGPVYLSGGRTDNYISWSSGQGWHTSASLDNAAGLAGAGAILTATAITSTRAAAFQDGVTCKQVWLTTDSGHHWTPVTVGPRPARCLH